MIRSARDRSLMVRGIAMLVLFLCTVRPGSAVAEDNLSFQTVLEDTKQYFTAPIRWDAEDWAFFGGALIAIVGSHQFDDKVRHHFESGPNDGLNGGKDKNSIRDALPTLALIGGTGFFAVVSGNSDGYRETVSLLEAGVFSGITAEALGLVGGRERPDATTSSNRWRAGGDSFPSLHSSVAFAVGTVFAESGSDDYRWIRRFIGYGVAGATAFIRVKEDDHWVSDSVAGAALGLATASFVLNREDRDDHSSLQIQPIKKGWMIAYAKQFH